MSIDKRLFFVMIVKIVFISWRVFSKTEIVIENFVFKWLNRLFFRNIYKEFLFLYRSRAASDYRIPDNWFWSSNRLSHD